MIKRSVIMEPSSTSVVDSNKLKSSSSSDLSTDRNVKSSISPDSKFSPPRSIDLTLARIRDEQHKDPTINHLIELIKMNPLHYSHEMLDDGILFKIILRSNHRLTLPWIPNTLHSYILSIYHDHPLSGHFGIKRTYLRLRNKYFWPRMYDSIRQYIRSCAPCAQSNASRQKPPGFLQSEGPPDGVFEIFQMDFWKAPVRSSDGNFYVLIITDRLSKFVFARSFPCATASAAAQMLFEDIVLHHGSFRVLQSDQGSHFRNELVSALSQLVGFQQSFSIPYHPMSNGQVERFNSTFCDQLKKYCSHNLTDWDIYLPSIVWAYNSSVHATTRYIPYELAFNRRLICPFDPPSSTVILHKPHEYWEKANRFKLLAIRAARYHIQQQHISSKHRYNRNRSNPVYQRGDLVWVKILNHRSKFEPRFHGPFVILDCLSDVKYRIEHLQHQYSQEEHINNLLPFYERH